MKKILLCSIFLVIIITGKAQIPPWNWVESSLGAGSEVAHKSVTDHFGNVYLVGIFNKEATFGNITLLNPDSTNDIFIVKYSNNGDVVWARSAGGNSYDICNSICIDNNGDLIITGMYMSPSITFGSTVLTNNFPGTSDIFVVKYDQNGNVIWAKKYGGSVDEEALSICSDNSNNIYVCGNYSSTLLSFGTINLINTTSNGVCRDLFIVKLDSNGNTIWAKSAGGNANNFDEARHVAISNSGDVFIAGNYSGTTMSFGSVALTSANSSKDIFLTKLNSSGTALWARNTNGTSKGDLFGLTVDYYGNPIISGYYQDSTINFNGTILANPTFNHSYNPEMFLVKYDGNGNVLWGKSIGSNCSDMGGSVTTDNYGYVYALGSSFGEFIHIDNDSLYLGNPGSCSAFSIKLDPYGNYIWSYGSRHCMYVSSSINSNSEFFLTGNYNDTLTLGTSSLINTSISTNSDNFIAKMGNVTSISNASFKTITEIYPNPSQGIFSVKYKQGIKSVEILSVLGERISIIRPETFCSDIEIDLSEAPKGIYLLKIDNGHNICVKKVVLN